MLAGYDRLIVPVGGQRQPYGTEEKETVDDYGSRRTNYNMYMDGAAIMDFALEHVPDAMAQILQQSGLTKEQVDYYVFHQANHFMLLYLQQKCELLDCPYWNDVSGYGNTGPCSIPIALSDLLASEEADGLEHVMIIGFGVGLSWGGAMIDLRYAKA